MKMVSEKRVDIPERVEDLCGLYLELRKADFFVKNVAADVRGTYVYLDPKEEKDPSEIIRSWVGRQPPRLGDRSRFRAMKRDAETLSAVVVALAEPVQEKAVVQAEGGEEKTSEEKPAEEKPAGWWKKLWKKLI